MDSTAAESPEEQSEKKTTPKELIKYIHEQGIRAGIAIKPKTDVSVLYDILDSSTKEEVPDVRSHFLHTEPFYYQTLTTCRWS